MDFGFGLMSMSTHSKLGVSKSLCTWVVPRKQDLGAEFSCDLWLMPWLSGLPLRMPAMYVQPTILSGANFTSIWSLIHGYGCRRGLGPAFYFDRGQAGMHGNRIWGYQQTPPPALLVS